MKIVKNSKNSETAFFVPKLGGLRGNVCASSIPRWKAHDLLRTRKFSASSCSRGTMSKSISNMILWVTFRLHVKPNGYFYGQHLWAIRQGNGYATTLPLKVFTQRNFTAEFIRQKLMFAFQKQQIQFLNHHLGDLRVKLYALHL